MAVVLCFQFFTYLGDLHDKHVWPSWVWPSKLLPKFPDLANETETKENNSYFSPKKLWNCVDSATPMNPTEPIRLIISLVELSERCSSGVTVQGTKLDDLYYHKFYPPSVFSLAENLQLMLGISTTYGLWEAEWPIVKNVGLVIRWSPSSSPALAACWFCSRSSPIQIHGHACK